MNIGLDLDGTLVGCAERHTGLMQVCARQLGVEFDPRAYWLRKRQGDDNARALARGGIQGADKDLLCALWVRQIERLPWLWFDRPIPGALPALDRLADRGHRLHLITARTNAGHLRLQLERLGIARRFASVTVVSGQGVAAKKASALRQWDCDVFVGDTESDHDAARQAEVPFQAMCSGMRSPEFFASRGIAPISHDLAEWACGLPD